MLTFKDYLIQEDKDPCWKDYEMVGMKKKNGKKVPNCVPKEEVGLDESSQFKKLDHALSYAKDKVKSHKDDDDGIEVYQHKEGGYSVNHTMNSSGRNTLKNSGAKHLKTIYKEELEEATYQGKEVSLNKPMAGDVKKSKVYVDPDGDGKAKKVEFGDPNMTIKKHIPARRKSFRARHNCDNPGPKDKARYWSCKAW